MRRPPSSKRNRNEHASGDSEAVSPRTSSHQSPRPRDEDSALEKNREMIRQLFHEELMAPMRDFVETEVRKVIQQETDAFKGESTSGRGRHLSVLEAPRPLDTPSQLPASSSTAGGGNMEAVRIGDLIYLSCFETAAEGFISGDITTRDCAILDKGADFDGAEFTNNVFRITPMLKYRQRSELEAHKRANPLTRSISRSLSKSHFGMAAPKAKSSRFSAPSSLSLFDDGKGRSASSEGSHEKHRARGQKDDRMKRSWEREQELQQLANHESHENAALLEELSTGYHKDVVTFAKPFQLQHVRSGLFLTVMEESAPLDPECRNLLLTDGSPASVFRFMPVFRAQTEGSVVYYSQALTLESISMRDSFLHVSNHEIQRLPEDAVPQSTRLPKLLRTGRAFEINLSPDMSKFTIHQYARFSAENMTKHLRANQYWRLYHSQSEAFMLASCNPDKDELRQKRQDGTPSHIPYLKSLSDTREDRDPSDPANHVAKAVWTFETQHVTRGGVIEWGVPVRIKHVPSGRYLAIDVDTQLFSPDDEQMYLTKLTDDIEDRTLFTISSADNVSSNIVNDADVSLRVEFQLVQEDKVTSLYLHNTGMPKPLPVHGRPKQGTTHNVFSQSFQLAFTTERSAQDIFKLVRVAQPEADQINLIRSYLAQLTTYAKILEHTDATEQEFFKSVVVTLEKLIDMQTKGTSSIHLTPENMIKKANDLPPAEFSAQFRGEPEPAMQQMCCDMKVMDSVFAINVAPYNRAAPNRPFRAHDLYADSNDGPKAVAKFAHVCLQKLFSHHTHNQEYFGNATVMMKITYDDEPGSSANRRSFDDQRWAEKSWIDVLLETLEDPLGPVVSLSELLSTNRKLMTKHATAKLAERFTRMIQKLGPQSRFLLFFAKICSVEDTPIVANQELVLRLIFMNKRLNDQVLLSVQQLSGEQVTRPSALTSWKSSQRPRSFYSKSIKLNDKPPKYIGKKDFEVSSGFDRVYVSWSGLKEWSHDAEELFWSAEGLGIEDVFVIDGQEWVPVESLCWVLDDEETLGRAITRKWEKPWPDEWQSEEDKLKIARWRQLAQYFVQQLYLLSRLCLGRSYSCIQYFEGKFPYTMVVSMCMNVKLPPVVRSASCDFMRALYLDRYPQLPNSGCPSMPMKLWVFDATEGDLKSIESRAAARAEQLGAQAPSLDIRNPLHAAAQLDIPVIRPLSLKDAYSLPAFRVNISHVFAFERDNEFLHFPNENKFFLLYYLCADYLRSIGMLGRMVHEEPDNNDLTTSILRVLENLMDFGFLNSPKMFKAVVPPLTALLDGTTDRPQRAREEGGDDMSSASSEEEDSALFEAFDPPEKRYEMTKVSPSVTRVKTLILDVLRSISNLRANFRLAKLLNTFKTRVSEGNYHAFIRELTSFHQLSADSKESYHGSLNEMLFRDFEVLFTDSDSDDLDLNKLASVDGRKIDMNALLEDLLFYEDDELFAKSLSLLDDTYGQRRMVLQSVRQVILLFHSRIPVFGDICELRTQLGYMHYLTVSTEVWGSAKTAEKQAPKEYNEIMSLAEQLSLFLRADLLSTGTLEHHADGGFNIRKFLMSTSKSSSVFKLPAKHHTSSRKQLLRGHSSQDGDHVELPSVPESKMAGVEEAKVQEESPAASHARREELRASFRFTGVNKFYQDVLRASNVQLPLLAALTIDYNLAFKVAVLAQSDGRDGVDFERINRSRIRLVEVQHTLVQVLADFVFKNRRNQRLVFTNHLEKLRSHLGPLEVPPLPRGVEQQSTDFRQVTTEAGETIDSIGTDLVIIQCLRHNDHLVDEEVPRDLIEQFGTLVNRCEDPSTSHLLDFFFTICQPGPDKANKRNQEYTVDVILSPKLHLLRDAVHSVFKIIASQPVVPFLLQRSYSNATPDQQEMGGDRRCKSPKQPERIVELIIRAVALRNKSTTARLQAHKISVYATLSTLFDRMDTLLKQKSKEGRETALVFLNDVLFLKLLHLLKLQMQALVLDPRLLNSPSMYAIIQGSITVIAEFLVPGDVIEHVIDLHECSILQDGFEVATEVFRGLQRLRIEETEEQLQARERITICATSLLRSTPQKDNSQEHLLLRNAARKLADITNPELTTPLDDDLANDSRGISRFENESSDEIMLDLRESAPARGRAATAIDAPPEITAEEEESAEEQPEVLFKYFVEALTHNKDVNRRLRQRRFEFVLELSKLGRWDALVRRMVQYVHSHNYDYDKEHCIRIFEVLRFHLSLARSEEDGEEIKNIFRHENHHRFEDYVKKQENLDRLGVTEAVLTAVATSDVTYDGSFGDRALELLLELTNGGNGVVQQSIYRYVSSVDKESKFLLHIQSRLKRSLLSIQERKDALNEVSQSLLSSDVEDSQPVFSSIVDRQKAEYASAEETLELLRRCFEGHHLSLQNIFREQPMNRTKVNLVEFALRMLASQFDTRWMLEQMERFELRLLAKTLDMLVEATQGPCGENQELVVKSHGVMHAISTILRADFKPAVPKKLEFEVKLKAVTLLSSCLEGRRDRTVHLLVEKAVEPQILHDFRQSLDEMQSQLKAIEKQKHQHHLSARQVIGAAKSTVHDIGNLLGLTHDMANSQDRMPSQDTLDLSLVALKSVFLHLDLVGGNLMEQVGEMDEMNREVASVEVEWKGRIEVVSFRLPKFAPYLRESARLNFFDKTNLATSDKRMRQLLQASPNFINEMKVTYNLATRYKLYRYVDKRITSIKWAMYALVVLLNLNVMMNTYGDTHEGEGYNSAYQHVFVNGEISTPVLITWVLGSINLAGYVLIVMFLGAKEVPIIIHQTDKLIEAKKLEIEQEKERIRDGQKIGWFKTSVTRYPRAFQWWTVTLLFNIMFIIMHIAAYGKALLPLYYFLVFGINLPWTLSCVRNYIRVPNTAYWRIFVIAYDTILTQAFFRNHVLLMFCSVLGFNSSPYFGFMLLDIINNSSVLQDIIKSITVPAQQLITILYLFVVTVVIYSQLGMQFFEDDFVFDVDAQGTPDDPAPGCHSVVSCFWLIFAKAVPAGNMNEVLDVRDNRGEHFKGTNYYLGRVLYELSFFIWVGILLFNIVTGIMIDTFSSLREQKNRQSDILANECFVCGVTRSKYDDNDKLINAPSFDDHCLKDHNIWNYIFFFAYLESKDPMEYTGVESYVWHCLQKKNRSWIPTRNFFYLQEALLQKRYRQDDDSSSSSSSSEDEEDEDT